MTQLSILSNLTPLSNLSVQVQPFKARLVECLEENISSKHDRLIILHK